MKSLLCLALCEKTLEENKKRAIEYRSKVDLFELRADFLEAGEWSSLRLFPEMVKMVEKNVILTVRRAQEGGHFKGTENDRHRILEKALSGRYSFVDIEEDFDNNLLEQKIVQSGKKIIRSIHDKSGLPLQLEERILRLKHNKSDIPKAAVMLKSTGDLVKLVKVCFSMRNQNHIIIGMGDFGFLTRILASPLGSYLTYCSSEKNKAAPGHVTPDILKYLYRYKQINEETKIFGVIGNPVMHSFSPHIHNKGFAELNLNAVYIPICVDKVEDFFSLANLLQIQGASVTIPHKQAVIPFLSDQDEAVKIIKACNTICYRDIRRKDRREQQGWYGINTDVKGFIEPLLDYFKTNMPGRILKGSKAAVIGAGGAARAIIYILRKYGFSVLVLNRTREKALKLASEFQCLGSGLDKSGIEKMQQHNDVIVQTTSVGMSPETEADPIKMYQFRGHEVVYDIVYNPQKTQMLKRAEKAGCPVITGDRMLIGQALHQFKLFTGKEFPLGNQLTFPLSS